MARRAVPSTLALCFGHHAVVAACLSVVTDYSTLTARGATDGDAGLLRSLAPNCAPLDVHTPYTYWVLSHMFGRDCFIAYDGDIPAGFATSVISGKSALLWQIGVLPGYRGFGVSQLLIDAVVVNARRLGRWTVETSIDPENTASHAAFTRYAREHKLVLAPAGSVDLVDELDPGFRELETLYKLVLIG